MEYILKSANATRLPYTDKSGVYGIDVLMKTGVVGQTYNGFENLDVGFCPIQKTDTTESIAIKITEFGKRFVVAKYPTV